MTSTIHQFASVAAIHEGRYRKAVTQGASLAFLALELQDISNTGAVSEAIREAMRRGDRVQPIIKMVQDQWRDGACKELVRLLGKPLLRKILSYEF